MESEAGNGHVPGGVRVVGVIAFFVRDAAEELRGVVVAAEGSQFRSRDLQAATAMAQ
jgi:hypothetical protein